jgi:hypothetical protein
VPTNIRAPSHVSQSHISASREFQRARSLMGAAACPPEPYR